MSSSDWSARRAIARGRLIKGLPWVAAFLVVYAIFLLTENAIGDDFHKCISDETAYYAGGGQNHHPKSLPLYFRFAVQNICTLNLIDRHNGLFALIGTLAIAAFTWTLWRSTHKLWLAGESQRTIFDQQTEILRKQLVVQNPDLAYSLYRVTVKRSEIDILELQEYRIALEWENFGKTMATNVNYWIGEPAFVDGAGDIGPHLDMIGREFKKRVFGAEGKPGHIFVSPGGTVSTDEFVVTREQLSPLFTRKKTMLIWCVIRYGSKLEDPKWFAEVAVWLKFVLETDPDKPLIEPVTALPFRVAVLGYRYRESHD